GAAREGLLARHPLVSFFLTAYAGSWLVALPYRRGADLVPLAVPGARLPRHRGGGPPQQRRWRPPRPAAHRPKRPAHPPRNRPRPPPRLRAGAKAPPRAIQEFLAR